MNKLGNWLIAPMLAGSWQRH